MKTTSSFPKQSIEKNSCYGFHKNNKLIYRNDRLILFGSKDKKKAKLFQTILKTTKCQTTCGFNISTG